MSRQQDTPVTLIAGGTIAAFRRVAFSGATIIQASATEIGFGVSQHAATTGQRVSVRGYGDGTCKVTAAGAITAGDDAFPAADGKVSATAVTAGPMGKVLEAATADGDIVELFPNLVGTQST